MKKKHLLGGLLLAAALMSAPAVTAEAKEIKAGEDIPLTAEYFPDEYFLKWSAHCDKNKDGSLSPEEIAAVTSLWIQEDLTDFSQVQYFTGLRELKMDCEWDYGDRGFVQYGVWAGNVLDLRAFPKLEKAELVLNSSRASEGSPDIQVQVSGLQHLKELKIWDAVVGEPGNSDGSNAFLGSADLRDTPALETLWIADVKDVTFDAGNHIKSLTISNVKEFPLDQIAGFTDLEYLRIMEGAPHFTRLDLSKNSALRELRVDSISLNDIALAGAEALETVEFHGTELTELFVVDCPSLKDIQIKCPKLERLFLNEENVPEKISIESDALMDLQIPSNKSLRELTIKGGQLAEVDSSQSQNLEKLSLECPLLKKLDVTDNTELTMLYIKAALVKSLDLSKNTELKHLSAEMGSLTKLNLKYNKWLEQLWLTCSKLHTLDLTANTKLRFLGIAAPVRSLDLSRHKSLEQLLIENNQSLVKLNLSKNTKIWNLRIKNTSVKSLDVSKLPKLSWLELNENKKLTSMDLSQNKKLKWIDLRNNALKELQLPRSSHMSSLFCQNNQLKTLDIPRAEYLDYLDCSNNKLTKLNLLKAIKLDELNCSNNKLTKLDISKTTSLKELDCSKNRLTKLDISGLKYLTKLNCSKNKLARLDASRAKQLKELVCDKKVSVKGYKGKIKRI